MAFTSQGSIGTGTRTGSGTSTTITTSATANAGDLVVVWIAKDNTGTSDGDNNEITDVSDSAGNTYTEAKEWTNTAGSASDGATVGLYYKVLTNQLASSGTITVTHSSVTDVALKAWRFTISNPGVLVGANATPVVVDGTAHGASIASGTIASREYLFIRATAIEDEALTAETATTSYTSITGLPSTTAGSNAANIFVAGEFYIATTTASTSNPTFTTAASTQSATVFIALYEDNSRSATAASTLAAVTSSGAGSLKFSGTEASTLNAVTSSASGTHTEPGVTATAASTLNAVTVSSSSNELKFIGIG